MATIETQSIIEIPQQFLLGEHVSQDVEFRLGRACVAHCAAAVEQFCSDEVVTVETLTDFVLEYGAGSNSEFYHEGRGWNNVAIADLLRLQGFSVISQNLNYDPAEGDFNATLAAGRAKSDTEKASLNLYWPYGGADRRRWLDPLDSTLKRGGYVISTISIPLLSGEGFGGHSVVLTDIDIPNGTVEYFDPDFYNVNRYGSQPITIGRHSSKPLHYIRTVEDHLSVMTGEVLHILPGTQATGGQSA